jgi:hypothetical protein
LFICIGLVIAIPLAISSIINNSAELDSITLAVQRGTALVRRNSTGDPIGVTPQLELPNIPDDSTIIADENVQALLTIRTPGDKATLLTVQIYGSTNLDITRARTPRFAQSTLPHQVLLNVDTGRVRINVVGGLDRPVDNQITSPQATLLLEEGAYAIEVTNDETQVTVRAGAAVVHAQNTLLPLTASQRTIVRLGGRPVGILKPEVNLVVNGDLSRPLSDTWEVTNDLQETSELSGTVTIQSNGGQRWAQFDRTGVYHAETRLRQVINKDVRGVGSLKLHFRVRILDQDVPVCGQAGSECPMMLLLDYKDDNGTDNKYLQGFYWAPDPMGLNPLYNTSSGMHIDHIAVQRDVPYTYDLDLIKALKTPSQITAITLYASGHSYHAAVTEIELLAEQ